MGQKVEKSFVPSFLLVMMETRKPRLETNHKGRQSMKLSPFMVAGEEFTKSR